VVRGVTVVLALLLTQPLAAQVAAPATPPDSLRDRLGVSTAERALREGPPAARERAILRLGALGSPRSLELLVKSLEGNGLAQSARERLLAVRALAPYARSDRVRDCLMRVMTGISAAAERADPLLGLLRDTAALALAKSGGTGALTALARALRQPGPVAQAARSALVAHPPLDLGALVRAHGSPTPELVRVLEQLEDQRGIEFLRGMVERGGRELRAEAAIALTRLGSREALAMARRAGDDPRDPTLLLAAAEILTIARDPAGAPLLVALLGRSETRQRALTLARQWDEPAIERALSLEAARADASELPEILGALARAPGAAGCQALERLARREGSSALAFSALSHALGEPARQTLERLLADPATRRAAARAGVLRAVALDDAPRGLEPALAALLRSKLNADRAVGGFGLSQLDAQRARELVWSADPVVAEAAARAAPFVGEAVTAADRLVREPAGRLRTQLSLSLVDPRARARVPTSLLVELLEAGDLASPLALLALGERDSPHTRGRLLEQLASPDPLRRSQTALGLGESLEATALGVLEAAYRFEIEPDVRRAIVQAVSRRPQAVRRRTLELAAALDADPATRALARLTLAGATPAAWSRGPGTFLAGLERGDGAARGALVTAPGGLALPVLADPDGMIALAGLAAGPIAVRVALLPAGDKSRPAGSQ
jgi:cellulose synthase operon protein C